MPREFYSASEAAQTLGISLDTLRRWDRQGRIKTKRDSSNRRIVTAREIDRLRGEVQQQRAISAGTQTQIEENRKAQKKTDDAWSRDKEGTRPDGKRLRDAETADDDVNKVPGGVGGQGTRADGRARAPDSPQSDPKR